MMVYLPILYKYPLHCYIFPAEDFHPLNPCPGSVVLYFLLESQITLT